MRIYLYSFERLASLIFSRLFNRTSELCAWVVICTLARVNNCLMSRGQQFLSVHAAAAAAAAGAGGGGAAAAVASLPFHLGITRGVAGAA